MADNKSVYVGNLNYKTDTTTLGTEFGKFGKVIKARIITYRFRGNITSRGFGFVDFETAEAAKKAIDECQKTPLIIDDRTLKVVASRPPVKRERTTAFLGGITQSTTQEQIKAAFPTGKTVSIHPPRGDKRGFAFVNFENEAALMTAIKNTREIKIGDAAIQVRIARPLIRRPFRRGYRRATKANPAKE